MRNKQAASEDAGVGVGFWSPMSEANSSGNPTVRRSSRNSRPFVAVGVAGGVLLSLGFGFWLGRHEPSRGSGPATQPSATDLAEQSEAVEKANYLRAAKQIELLDREKKVLDLELNEHVLKKMAEQEVALGGDQINTFQHWNGKQLQFERLIEDRMRILPELEGVKSRLRSLTEDLDEGRTPQEIEEQVCTRADTRSCSITSMNRLGRSTS